MSETRYFVEYRVWQANLGCETDWICVKKDGFKSQRAAQAKEFDMLQASSVSQTRIREEVLDV